MSFAFTAGTSSLSLASTSVLASSTFATDFMAELTANHPPEPEYFQAVQEVAHSVAPVIDQNPQYRRWKILERIARPNHSSGFKITWADGDGNVHVNNGWRIQQNSALGPYKGGLRFHSSVNLSVLKFLAFEQVFKNSLTGLRMGGAKGGADFDPKGKSDMDVMRFCHAFMMKLARHIGPNTDVPAGDIGVGKREIGYLYRQYMKLRREYTGVMTGKGVNWGGSLLRPEATGYGSVYFAAEMLDTRSDAIDGKRVAVSGSGNVAQFTAEKVIELGGLVVTMSDSGGTIVDNDGIDRKKLDWIMDWKNNHRGRIAEYADEFNGPAVSYHADKRPWTLTEFELAFPSATQNEINEAEAKAMIAGGCFLVSEGANMPCEPGAIAALKAANALYGPGKAANAGGVAVSGLEMAQNFQGIAWTREEVDRRLREIMKNIHRAAVETAARYGSPGDYEVGANIAGFIKVADAMIELGL